MSAYSINGDTFTKDGKPIEGVLAYQTKTGRWRFVNTDTGRVIASGMSPEEFARRYWFAGEWADPAATMAPLFQPTPERAHNE